MAVMWQKISPSAYRHIYHEDVLTLPTERRIRQLTSAIGVDMELGSSTKAYLRARISKLEAKELMISVLIDEIYSSKQVQYVNGSFYGNEDENVSKTVLSIMIASIAGKYRDVIAMIPCSSLNAEKQYEIWSKLLPPLCEIGFDPVATITDGNHVNHKFFKDLVCCGTLNLCISNPCNQLIDKMFLLFDTVHIFKCFYTNFLNKELFICPSFTNEHEFLQGNFGHIRQLYELELGKPIKMAYRLSDRVLNPASIERTNVSLADACFHQSTINALKYYANHGFPDFLQTANVLQIFKDWFNVVNVKSRYSDQRTRDVNRAAITRENKVASNHLSIFTSWLKKWRASKKPGLSSETFQSSIQTSEVLVNLPDYLINEKGLEYVLLGNIQSDPLERRFSWYRQSSGANYHISVLQIIQSEKIIRTRSLIEQGFDMSQIKDIFENVENFDSLESHANALSEMLNFRLENIQFHIDVNSEDQSIIYYVAGAISRSIIKKIKCEKCTELLSGGKMEEHSVAFELADMRQEFMAQISRGGLLKPSDVVYITCIHAFALYNAIKNNSESFSLLMKFSNPRNVFTTYFLNLIEESNCLDPIMTTACKSEHKFQIYVQKVSDILFNLMAKNHVSELNSSIHVNKKRSFTSANNKTAKTRKIQKLTSS